MVKQKPETKEVVVGQKVAITAPKMRVAMYDLEGDAPLIQHKMSEKVRKQLIEGMKEGDKNKKKNKSPKDFNAEYLGAMHKSVDGWYGIPAMAFKNAMVAACRVCGFKMTIAKMSVFTLADGYAKDGTPLVKITKGKPKMVIHPTVVANGRWNMTARPMFNAGWKASVRIKYDSDMFSLEAVTNMLLRVGIQVGVLEGRPFSKMSCGMGWGTFTITSKEDKDEAA